MTKKKRPKFVATETRKIVAANVRRLIDQEFPDCPNETAKIKMLAERIGTSYSTAQRVLNAQVGVTVDILTQLGHGFRCHPADLLRSQKPDRD